MQIENPRQLSASLYPPRYGLRSPMFARAALVPNGRGAQLLVSGTASIVGHESLHIGDPERQLEETARNFEALVETAMRADSGRPRARACGWNHSRSICAIPATTSDCCPPCAACSPSKPSRWCCARTSAGASCWWRSRERYALE